ncbi:hypothetical protein EIP91_000903 [Steccherinum ochraceum]|uniref:Uncharacterized protein n=1 Tax=Steccherinum ochraceum TaxID=92696 RepID=A0A4R0RLH3_9APHY|nr:hypothetical protein EIP91_000903 [Steccherinum ochraceum]
MKNSTGLYLCILTWFAINAADGVWIYYYVKACVDPNPRTGVNKTHAGFEGYEVMMFIFGFFWTSVNTALAWGYFTWALESRRNGDKSSPVLKWTVNLLIAFPIAAFLCIMPAFGGWIVVPLAQRQSWNHRCDSFPMYAVLDGRGFKDPSYIPNVVHFYQGRDELLFSYDISDGASSDFWTFQLREFDAAQSSIPLELYPTLQHIQYDFINDTLTGNCTLPATPGSSITNSTSCMTGTFNPNDWLSFNLTSTIPLNNSAPTDTIPSTTTVLRTVDKQWAFNGDDAPSLILDTVDPLTDKLQSTVLRTAVTKRGDCTQLKVCLGGTDRPGGLVGAEVLSPMGLIMIRQSDYAQSCTIPDSN